MKSKIIMFSLIFILLILIFAACSDKNKPINEEDLKNEESIEDVENSTWIAYWDLENAKEEINELKNNLDSIYYFAAYFDGNDKLYLPQEIIKTFSDIKVSFKDEEFNHYLSFVNDIKYENKSSSLKDTELLYRLLENEESRRNHIEGIIKLTKEYGFDGIEIDYERIRKDMQLWDKFLIFCDELYKRADNENLKLRITLESSTPFDKLSFPKGPAYSVMCYNLYGSHSGAGPKADIDFLKKILENMSYLSGRKELAIATGGFDWTGDKKAISITEEKAIELQNEYKTNYKRDLSSKAVYFDYVDNNGVSHTVYYADNETLSHWISIINESNKYGIALWKLGGNKTLRGIIY